VGRTWVLQQKREKSNDDDANKQRQSVIVEIESAVLIILSP
jgi:hypothetical protein